MDRTRDILDKLVAWSPVLLLGALAALTYWLDAQVQPQPVRRDGSARHDPDLFLQDFRAVTFDAHGQPREALAAYEKATGLAPEDYDAWLGLGETYVALGRTADAEKVLERLRERDRRNAATLHHVITTKTPR